MRIRDPQGYRGGVGDDPYAGWVLSVVDAQKGFDDPAWGARNNPACDNNIAALVHDWSSHDRPLVYVRHDSTEDDAELTCSVLTPGTPGNELRDYLGKAEPDLLVSKHVNSAFHGSPDPARVAAQSAGSRHRRVRHHDQPLLRDDGPRRGQPRPRRAVPDRRDLHL
jgi:nicotinamidase-related amidase